MWHPLREPRPIQHLASRRFLREILRKSVVSRTEILDTARVIMGEHIRSKDVPGFVQEYMDVCCSIDEAKIRVKGHAGISHIGNSLMTHVAGLWLEAARVTEVDSDFVLALSERIKADPVGVWMVPKLHYVQRTISQMLRMQWFAKSISLNPQARYLLDRLEVAVGRSIDRTVDEVLEALHENRDYGIKPAFFSGGIKPRKEHVWLVTDTDLHMLDALGMCSGVFAWFLLTEPKFIRSTESYYEEFRPSEAPGVGMNLAGPDVLSHVGLLMDRSGGFYVDQHRIISAEEVFRSLDKGREYSVFRLMSILHLYDLTVPIKIVNKLPKLPTGGFISRVFGNDPVEEILNPKLLIPRMKELFGNRSQLVEALIREMEEGERLTRQRALRRHECIDHVRLLPSGKKASPGAIRRAHEAGIKLASGETFVRKHERGSFGPIVGPHEAVLRK